MREGKDTSHDRVEKYEKHALLDALKIHFQRFFTIRLLHLIQNGLNGVNINLLTSLIVALL